MIEYDIATHARRMNATQDMQGRLLERTVIDHWKRRSLKE